jgi:hypothetical protein
LVSGFFISFKAARRKLSAFVKERKHNLTGKIEPVGIDDASAFLRWFEYGSLATFEATRYTRGHKALYTLEINGEHAEASPTFRDGLATDYVTDAVLRSAKTRQWERV